MTRPCWLLSLCLLVPLPALALMSPSRVARQAAPPTPTLLFNDVRDATVCGSVVVTWFYSGPADKLSLTVTNNGVQSGPTTAGVQKRATQIDPSATTIELASSLDPNNKVYIWTTITLSQGWYRLVASIPQDSFEQSSDPFFIRDPGSTSCGVVPIQPSSSSTTTTSPTSTVTSTSSAPSQTPSLAPVGATSGHLNVGAIAGGVVGGVCFLALMLFLYIFFVCRPRRNQSLKNPRAPSSPSKFAFGSSGAGWGGLGSVDHHTAMSPPPVQSTDRGNRTYAGTRHISHTESLATFVDPTAVIEPKYGSPSQEDIDAYLHGSRSRRGSVQHTWYSGSPPSEEKLGAEELELEGVPNLGYMNTTNDNNDNNDNNNRLNHRSHSTSTFTSDLNMGLGQPQRRSSLSSPLPTNPSVDVSLESSTYSTAPPPPAPVVQQPQKKSARKPVPVYTPSFDPKAQGAEATAGSPLSPASSAPSPTHTPASPTAFSGALPSGPPPTPAAGGHYSTRGSKTMGTPGGKEKEKRSKSKPRGTIRSAGSSQESVVDAGAETDASRSHHHDLVHKSSFGPGGIEGKPLHYLVPDILPSGGSR